MDNSADNEKTLGIVSYLTLIGTIIAMVQNSEKRSAYVSFHIRQALGTMLLFFALGYPIGYFDSWMVSSAFYLFFFILWIYGFMGAVQRQMNLIPVLGPFFQNFFKSL